MASFRASRRGMSSSVPAPTPASMSRSMPLRCSWSTIDRDGGRPDASSVSFTGGSGSGAPGTGGCQTPDCETLSSCSWCREADDVIVWMYLAAASAISGVHVMRCTELCRLCGVVYSSGATWKGPRSDDEDGAGGMDERCGRADACDDSAGDRPRADRDESGRLSSGLKSARIDSTWGARGVPCGVGMGSRVAALGGGGPAGGVGGAGSSLSTGCRPPKPSGFSRRPCSSITDSSSSTTSGRIVGTLESGGGGTELRVWLGEAGCGMGSGLGGAGVPGTALRRTGGTDARGSGHGASVGHGAFGSPCHGASVCHGASPCH